MCCIGDLFYLVVFAKKGVAIHVVPKWVDIEPLNMTSLTGKGIKIRTTART